VVIVEGDGLLLESTLVEGPEIRVKLAQSCEYM